MVIQPKQQRPWSMISMLTIMTISGIVVLLLLSACTGGAPGATNQTSAHSAAATPATPIDWKQVDQAMGKAGAMQPGGVYKYSFPRTDLNVTLSNVSLKAGFALYS